MSWGEFVGSLLETVASLTAVPLHPWCCNGLCVFQVVQILVGVLCVLFSLRAAYSPLLVLHAPLCFTVTVSIPHIQVVKLWLVLLPAPSLLSLCSVCGVRLPDFGNTEENVSVFGEFLPAMVH